MPAWPGEPRFPGLYCPGLIEGFFFAASKRKGPEVFRGSIAPASLKAPGSRLFTEYVRRFPGLYCPGLIEGEV